MKFLSQIIIWIVLTSQVFGSLDDADYVPVGCYKDNLSNRTLPIMVANYRVGSEILSWNDLEGTVIKKCAIRAKSMGCVVFGIQFYGECWCGLQGEQTYDKYGNSTRCTETAPLVGKQRANYVYTITEENECSHYNILNSADRSQFHPTNGMQLKCDNGQIDENIWYRFEGAAGNAMANTCVNSFHCDTLRTGWFSGPYPQVVDGIQEGNVCFSWNGNCCAENVSVKVRNCGAFFVYKLSRNIRCVSRYCGNGQ